ncbi:MAG: hypothetical protein HQM10_20140 [Candidatus Riflebacteria bacterium]|nr:hypothetical protein [Candidatus Riflebacteria bacterium]
MNSENIISIDLGGTKLRVRATSPVISEALEFEIPGKNLRLMGELEFGKLLLTVKERVEKTFGKIPFCWLIGAAGARGTSDEQKIALLLSDLGIKANTVRVYSDFKASWAAAFNGSPGIISINGTGSIVFGKNHDSEMRKGGWGYLLDDTPSGACFGRLAAQGLMHHWESIQCKSVNNLEILADIYSRKYQQWPQEKSAFTDLIYSGTNIQQLFGGLAPLFLEASEAGCAWCRNHIDSSINLLFCQIYTIASEIFQEKPVSFCGIGGLWENSEYFVKIFSELLSSQKKNGFSEPLNSLISVKHAVNPTIAGPKVLFFLEEN